MPYDSIGLKESVPLSVSRSVLANDYLRISESFFRVDRSLVFPDHINVADASTLVKEGTVLSSDKLIYDSISYKGAIQVNALDKLIADYISYTKTYSPILFTILAPRVRPRYLTLLISDYNIIKDSGSYVKIKTVSIYDYKIAYDSIVSSKATWINMLDKLITDASYAKNETLLASDRIAYDSIDYNKAIQVGASDLLLYDNISYTKTYSPILFTILAPRVKPRYLTLPISDYVIVSDYQTTVKMKIVYALDSIFYDNTSYTKTYSPLLFTMLAYRVRPRYLTLLISDYSVVKDSGSYVNVKIATVYDYNIGYDYRPVVINRTIMVSDYKTMYDKIVAVKPISVLVYDKVVYDYVPSMNPSNVHFMSIYPNPTTYGILVSDYGIFYDSATAIRPYKPVVVLDAIGVKDGTAMKNRTVMAYDKLVADNVVLNKV